MGKKRGPPTTTTNAQKRAKHSAPPHHHQQQQQQHSHHDAGGVDVCADQLEFGEPPCCSHGPAILFQRFYAKEGNDEESDAHQKARKFFACSCCRDRKQCPLFCWADDFKRGKWNKHRLTIEARDGNAATDGEALVCFCRTCLLPLSAAQKQHHVVQKHTVVDNLGAKERAAPTQLLCAKENNKTNAQYLFNDAHVKALLDHLKRLKLFRVLCLGTPRFHEELVAQAKMNAKNGENKFDSVLFDIDWRFRYFFPKTFVHFNMFNQHFFTKEDGVRMQAWLESCDAIIVDPPFGGRMELLATTLTKLSAARTSEPPKLFVHLPYFLEGKLVEALPQLHMTDMIVDYDNHPTFQTTAKGASTKRYSPVRVFTNVPGNQFPLVSTALHDYRYCDVCQRSVLSTNAHCKECNACTSKDGTECTHCARCQSCVKSSWAHCKTCNKCVPREHKCTTTAARCHKCGGEGHKRAACPVR